MSVIRRYVHSLSQNIGQHTYVLIKFYFFMYTSECLPFRRRILLEYHLQELFRCNSQPLARVCNAIKFLVLVWSPFFAHGFTCFFFSRSLALETVAKLALARLALPTYTILPRVCPRNRSFAKS